MEGAAVKPKTILVAAGLYPPDIGGPATYARMIEMGLPKEGIEIVVVPFGKVRHLPKIVRHVAYIRLLYRTSKECDAIYALDSVSVGLPAYVVSYLLKKKFLLRLGGDYAWEQGRQRFGVTDTLDAYTEDRSRSGVRVRLLARLQDMVVRNADKVFVPSEYLKGIVATWRGVKTERIQVVYSALFPLKPEGTIEHIRAQLSYTGTVFVSAGRLVPWKGFEVLIESTVAAREQLPDISLVIAGGGPDTERLTQKIKSMDAASYIRLVGPLAKDALAGVIKGADVFVLNTGYEGLSHQLLEVMDLGVPIVTTDVGGNPELISDGVNGLLTTYNDVRELTATMLRMGENEGLRERCAQNARLRVNDFGQEKTLTTLACHLKDAL